MIVVASKDGVMTRFVIGCDDRALELRTKLKAAGYKVTLDKSGQKAERSQEEKNRATRIIGELFGH